MTARLQPKLDLVNLKLSDLGPGGSTRQTPFAVLRRPVGALRRELRADALQSPNGGPGAGPDAPALGTAPQDAVRVSITSIRYLVPEDLAALRPNHAGDEMERGRAPRIGIKELRQRHHEIARWMACGVPDSEICEALGVSQPHLENLRCSPTFQALFLEYMADRDDETKQIQAKLRKAASKSLDRLDEVLDREGDALPGPDTLRKIAATLLDRAGFAPVQRSVNLTAGLSMADIRAIREENSAAAATLIQQSPVAVHSPSGPAQPSLSERAEPRREPGPDSDAEAGAPVRAPLSAESVP